ncbi:MAG TPA: hypothetical protein VIQ27_05395, partial [Gemmatimonadales bacterium]
MAAKNDAFYDLSRARVSVTGQASIAASTATTSLPNGRIVTALFAGALFLSAFLLFVLEPMVAKSILPTLGGTPMVWNTRSRGTAVMDPVEAEAARDDRFTWALGKIWVVAKGLPPDGVERMVIASGNAIR